LPPHYKLETKPAGKHEFFLPEDLREDACREWAATQVQAFASRVVPVLDEESVLNDFHRHMNRFKSEISPSAEAVLVWFSGKDLMVAMKDWWIGLGVPGPDNLRTRVHLWMWNHPEETLAALSEWQELVRLLRQ
jgi:hypothetical protein